MKDIIDRINHIIATEGLTVGRLARLINVKDQTLRNSLIQRKNNPGLDVVIAICRYFTWLNPDWLLTGEGEIRRDKTEYDSLEKKPAMASEKENGYVFSADNGLYEELKKLNTAISELTQSNLKLVNSNQRLLEKVLGSEFEG